MLRLLPCVAVGGLTFFLCILRLLAQPAEAPAPAVRLPVTRVVLTNAGIGYFHREGSVTGNARVELKVPEEDVNDLILTLLATDASGGRQAYAYDNRAPAAVTLKAFRINLSENPGVSQLLMQVRGESVEIAFDEKSTVKGSILSIEKQAGATIVNGGTTTTAPPEERINLFTDDGLMSVPMAKVRRVKFLKPELQAEFKLALETLAVARGVTTNLADAGKSLMVTFNGNGERKVSLGYIADAPLWKPTYRLRTTDKGAVLEGLAAIENTTDEDWQNVQVTLVSARPIVYKMDLYEPLFIPRPSVEVELYASLRPPMYQGTAASFAGGGGIAGIQGGQLGQFGNLGNQYGVQGMGPMTRVSQNLGAGGGVLGNTGAAPRPRLSYEEFQARKGAQRPAAVDLVAAAAVNLGEAFEYDIKEPVTLARFKSALLPVMKESIEAERVSIYNAAAVSTYPLLGLRMKNTSKFFIAQGPLSVYDGDRLVGQARLSDVKPGESRLISYAIDLDVAMRTEAVADLRTPVSMKIADGQLQRVSRVKATHRYFAANKSATPKTVWITQILRRDWKLIAPAKPVEQTADYNRFELKLAANASGSIDVIEERDETSTFNLASQSADALEQAIQEPSTPPAVKAALGQLKALETSRAEVVAAILLQSATLKEYIDDQTRLRENLKTIPPDSQAYRRNLKTFDEQEEEIEKRRTQHKVLEAKRDQMTKEFLALLKTLKVE